MALEAKVLAAYTDCCFSWARSALAGVPEALTRAIRSHHVGFPSRLTVRRHRRWIQVVGARLVAGQECETFYSLHAETTWGSHGALYPRLDAAAIEGFASSLVHLFRARQASPPEPYQGTAVLAPAAVAVLLHEAVAHALEADVLAQGGDPEAAVGVAGMGLGVVKHRGGGVDVHDQAGHHGQAATFCIQSIVGAGGFFFFLEK